MKKILSILILAFILSSCNSVIKTEIKKDSTLTSVENHTQDTIENNNSKADNAFKNKDENTKEENTTTSDTKLNTETEVINNEEEIENINNKEIDFGLSPSKNHQTPEIPKPTLEMFQKYDAYYVGDTSKKVIYLTFDEGYENGYTSKILDILKQYNVKAAFFVTRPYINQNKDLIKRMVEEGHIVGNHSSTHPSMPSKANDIEKFKKEFEDTENAFKDVTGQDMPKFFRPPMGKYSEKSLYLTQKLGYKTVFWSFAHKDWIVDDQPSVETTLKRVLDRHHNGEIMLLHAVSKSNTEALGMIIENLRSLGYEFLPLTELP